MKKSFVLCALFLASTICHATETPSTEKGLFVKFKDTNNPPRVIAMNYDTSSDESNLIVTINLEKPEEYSSFQLLSAHLCFNSDGSHKTRCDNKQECETQNAPGVLKCKMGINKPLFGSINLLFKFNLNNTIIDSELFHAYFRLACQEPQTWNHEENKCTCEETETFVDGECVAIDDIVKTETAELGGTSPISTKKECGENETYVEEKNQCIPNLSTSEVEGGGCSLIKSKH